MIICPNCRHQEKEGTMFCSLCGEDLSNTLEIPTSNIPQTTESEWHLEPKEGGGHLSKSKLHGLRELTMHFDGGDKVIPVKGNMEIILGRSNPGQTLVPDIDLSDFGAYEAGVSRIHAKIMIKENRVTIMDLDSSNGTDINGERMRTHTAYTLNHGDEISLGKLVFQVLFTS